VYGHSFSPRFATEVRRWADARGLALVSIGYRNDWADLQWIEAGPNDFAQAMAGAEAVATNFFHGCVFALRNGRPFACEVSPYRHLKVTDLMTLLGGERHLIAAEAPPTDVGDLLDEPPAIGMMQRIEALRRTSTAYLDRALGAPPARSTPSTRAA
jgi:hypothetical protein